MWAPPHHDTDALNRLLQGYTRFATTADNARHVTLVLLIPHDSFPNCNDAAAISDLWWHPVFADKWRNVVKHVEFIRQPTRCIFTGAAGPMHHSKSLAMVTLSSTGQSIPAACLDWRPILLAGGQRPFIMVDCNGTESLLVERALRLSSLTGVVRWEGPLRSFSSTTRDKRAVFRGYLDADSQGPLAVQLRVCSLREMRALRSCFVGASTLFTEPSSLIADFGGIEALLDVKDRLESVVFISATKALVILQGSQASWEVALTEAATRDPISCITKIRWRNSRHNGRTWAKPLALDIDLRSARSRARPQPLQPGAEDPRFACLLLLRGALGADPDGLLHALMSSLATNSSISLVQSHRLGSLGVHEWAEIRDGLQAWSGQVRIQLKDLSELESLSRIVHGCCLDSHGETRTLELHSASLGHNSNDIGSAAEQGNGSGAVTLRESPLP